MSLRRARTASRRIRPGERRRVTATGQAAYHHVGAIHADSRADHSRGHDKRYSSAGQHGVASLRDSQHIRENGKSKTNA